MKKIHLFIFTLFIAFIIGSTILYLQTYRPTKTTKEITKQKPKSETLETEKTLNPTGEDVKILGEATEDTDLKKISSPINTAESKQIVFETMKLYSLINSYRKENNLTPLSINKSLEISAGKKIQDMIENDYFRHSDPENVESWYLFRTSGYEFKTAGENLSAGINSPWQVFEAWRNSEIHNTQLLNKTYLDMGLGTDCVSYKIANETSCIVVLHLGSL
ncbi:MAG: hypothetical protein H6772_05070 [Pseudomonadales bacterium]|nr:hypothetical protein [Pseudomonadales bacterium]